ncbi:MAG TPA: hypothetical protein VH008_03785 [Pseudonocardia sp.]|nr:hypothetical protein [Pseudonocardia sp.]
MDPIRPVVGGAVVLVLGFGVFTAVHFAGGGASMVPPVPTPTNYLPAPAEGSSVLPSAPALAEPPRQARAERATPAPAATQRQAAPAPAPRPTTRPDPDQDQDQLPTRVPADVPYASGDRLHQRSVDETARDPRAGEDHFRDDNNRVEDQMIQRMCDRGNLPAAYCGPADRDSYPHR